MNPKSARAAFLIAFGHLTIELCGNYLPVVYPILIQTLKLNFTQIGAIALVASAAVTLPQPLLGYLSDRWHADRLVALSVVWIGLAMGLVGFTWNYPSLLLLVALGGLGSAAFHPPGAVIASAGGGGTRKGAAMSIFSVGGNVGAAFSPLLMTAGIAWLGLHGTSILMPIALPIGLFLYFQLGQIARSRTAQSSMQPSSMRNGLALGLVLIVMVVMARSWFQVSLMTYLPAWIESQGRSVAAGGQMLFVLLICVGVGSLAGGTLSDRIGRWQVLALSILLLGPAQWLFVSRLGPLQTLMLGFMGFLIGASFPVSIVMAQEAWPWSAGVASGLVMGLGWLPGGLGAYVTGLIADHFSLAVGLRTLILPPMVGAACSLLYAASQRSQAQAAPRIEIPK
ncbi:MAG: MFS transporter [Anaerolineae bacterium]